MNSCEHYTQMTIRILLRLGYDFDLFRFANKHVRCHVNVMETNRRGKELHVYDSSRLFYGHSKIQIENKRETVSIQFHQSFKLCCCCRFFIFLHIVRRMQKSMFNSLRYIMVAVGNVSMIQHTI